MFTCSVCVCACEGCLTILAGVSCSTALGTGCGYGGGNDGVSGCLAGDLLGGVATALANLKDVSVSSTACVYNGFLVGVAVKIASFCGSKTGYGVVGEVVGGEYGISPFSLMNHTAMESTSSSSPRV